MLSKPFVSGTEFVQVIPSGEKVIMPLPTPTNEPLRYFRSRKMNVAGCGSGFVHAKPSVDTKNVPASVGVASFPFAKAKPWMGALFDATSERFARSSA